MIMDKFYVCLSQQSISIGVEKLKVCNCSLWLTNQSVYPQKREQALKDETYHHFFSWNEKLSFVTKARR